MQQPREMTIVHDLASLLSYSFTGLHHFLNLQCYNLLFTFCSLTEMSDLMSCVFTVRENVILFLQNSQLIKM